MTQIANPSHGDRAHAKYSPSGMERAVNCPPSVFYGDAVPDLEKSKFAAEGETAHELCELLLAHFLQYKEGDEDTKEPEFDRELYSNDMVRHARNYVQYVWEVLEPHWKKPHVWFIERRATGDKERGFWGTPDFVFIWKEQHDDGRVEKRIICVDFKYGEGVSVSIKKNWQLASYILCLMFEHEGSTPWGDAAMHVYQPRIEDGIKDITMGSTYIKEEFWPHIVNTMDLNDEWTNSYGLFEAVDEIAEHLKADTSWCKWCKVKGLCGEYHNEIIQLNIIEILEKVMEAGEDTFKSKQKLRKVLTSEELQFLFLHKSKIDAMLKTIPQILFAQLQNGADLDHVRLGSRKSNRQWIDDKDTVSTRLQELGFEEPMKLEKKLVTITDVEKKLGKKVDLSGLVKPQEERTAVVAIDAKNAPVRVPGKVDTKALLAGRRGKKSPKEAVKRKVSEVKKKTNILDM